MNSEVFSFHPVRIFISLFGASAHRLDLEPRSYPLGLSSIGRKAGSQQTHIHQDRFQFTAVAFQRGKIQNLSKWTGK
jgi:hypothetical protein